MNITLTDVQNAAGLDFADYDNITTQVVPDPMNPSVKSRTITDTDENGNTRALAWGPSTDPENGYAVIDGYDTASYDNGEVSSQDFFEDRETLLAALVQFVRSAVA